MIDYSGYILDFERINELTSHPNDNPNMQGVMSTGAFCYNINRKVIKQLVDEFLGYTERRGDANRHQTICEMLHYNRILVSKTDIRDKTITKIVEDELNS